VAVVVVVVVVAAVVVILKMLMTTTMMLIPFTDDNNIHVYFPSVSEGCWFQRLSVSVVLQVFSMVASMSDSFCYQSV